MAYEEVNEQQEAVKESNGALSQNGIITEIINRFQGSLPWLNRNNLNYFIRQQQALTAASTSMAPVIMVRDSVVRCMHVYLLLFVCVRSVESFDINCECTSSVRKIV
jgi:hypothetical protein